MSATPRPLSAIVEKYERDLGAGTAYCAVDRDDLKAIIAAVRAERQPEPSAFAGLPVEAHGFAGVPDRLQPSYPSAAARRAAVWSGSILDTTPVTSPSPSSSCDLDAIAQEAKQLKAFVYDLVDVGGEERRGPYSAVAKWDNVKQRARKLSESVPALAAELRLRRAEVTVRQQALEDAYRHRDKQDQRIAALVSMSELGASQALGFARRNEELATHVASLTKQLAARGQVVTAQRYRIEVLEEESVDYLTRAEAAESDIATLHLEAQGVHHYRQCSRNVVAGNSGDDSDLCLRCRWADAEALLAQVREWWLKHSPDLTAVGDHELAALLADRPAPQEKP